MRDFPVPAPLAGIVASVIAYREAIPAGSEVTERVLPDGVVRLIVELGEGRERAPGVVPMLAVGASVEPAILRLRGKQEGLSLALRPGAAAAVLGMPAHELSGRAVSLPDLWRGEEAGMLERLAAIADDAARVRLLLDILQRRLGRHGFVVGDVGREQAMKAAQLITRASGHLGLRQVAAGIGVGERRLQQIFRQHVGLSPREWSRLARLHGCLRDLREQTAIRWADLAVGAGFYDQPHLVNEFKALCGMTPGLFLERSGSVSSKTTAGGRSYPPRSS